MYRTLYRTLFLYMIGLIWPNTYVIRRSREISSHFYRVRYRVRYILMMTFEKRFHTPAPGKILFLDLRPEKRHVGWKKTILSNFCFGVAILIFVCLAANRNFVPKNLGEKLWFVGKRTKISIAAAEQKLLRIVFPTYISFFSGLNSKKSIFPQASVWIFFDKCLIVGQTTTNKG